MNKADETRNFYVWKDEHHSTFDLGYSSPEGKLYIISRLFIDDLYDLLGVSTYDYVLVTLEKHELAPINIVVSEGWKQ